MIYCLRLTTLLATLLSITFSSTTFAISPSVSEVKDTRTTGKFFAGCEVEVSLVGDEMTDVIAMRKLVTSAIDDTGRDIRSTESENPDFEKVTQFTGNKVTLKLKNPARKATSIKEIVGTIDLYLPKNDPQSVTEISQPLLQSGKKISVPSLTSSGVALTLYTASDYTEHRKAEAAQQALQQGLQNAFSQMLGGSMGSRDENSITFIISDPQQRIVDLSFVTATGEPIKSNGSMTSRGKEVVKSLSFAAPIPSDAKLRIYLATEKSMVKLPLRLVDIALP